MSRLRNPALDKHKKCLKFFDYRGHFPSLHQGDESPEWPKILETPFTFVALVFVPEGRELKGKDSCKDRSFIHHTNV